MRQAARETTPNKLRIRALDKDGKPVAGMRVELLAREPAGERAGKAAEAKVVALRTLSTSRDGFAIFSLSGPAALRSCANLAVRFAQNSELVFALDQSAIHAGSQYVGFTIKDGPWLELEASPGAWHDDGLEADDIWAIPGLFPDLGDLEFGNDYCGRLVPNDLTVRIANHNQVVRTGRNALTCIETGEGGCVGCGGLVKQGEGDGDRAITLHVGELINYEIKCARLGYTFGDLLYSLPLAPCESVTLAISHWEQRQMARAEQDSVSEERRNATYYRQNALSEAMGAASSSSHHGWALMAGNSSGSGGSGSGMVQGFLLKATSAFQTTIGASASGSYDRASFATNATRNFSDRIQQTSEAWRRDHQVVIMEQSESEDQQVSYRTVCNNNHCHVLNVFYHEVLNNFRVSTKMLGHREVWLVPYEVQEFDLHLAMCAKPFLLPFLIDPDLADCYRNLKIAGQASAEAAAPVDEFKIDVTIVSESGNNDSLNLFLMIRLSNGTVQTFPVPVFEAWNTGQSFSYVVNTPNFDPNDIHEVGIRKLISGGGGMSWMDVLQLSYTISAKDPGSGQWVAMGSGAAGPKPGTIISLVPASWEPPATDSAPTAAADQDCAQRLLAHLNCHKTYYNSLLWLLEDPNERFCRFDRITCGATGTSLADLVIPEPLAVLGCYVAFAKSGSDYIPYDGQPIVDERLLTLPTPGIFADAALGHCSACETIDPNVYWDWKDSPCMCGAKDVTLKTPTDTSLIQGGTTPFPGLATGVWATGVSAPGGEVANSLVDAFGGALATAMMSKDSGKEMSALQDLLGKMTVALKDLIPGAAEDKDKDKDKDKKPG